MERKQTDTIRDPEGNMRVTFRPATTQGSTSSQPGCPSNIRTARVTSKRDKFSGLFFLLQYLDSYLIKHGLGS